MSNTSDFFKHNILETGSVSTSGAVRLDCSNEHQWVGTFRSLYFMTEMETIPETM